MKKKKILFIGVAIFLVFLLIEIQHFRQKKEYVIVQEYKKLSEITENQFFFYSSYEEYVQNKKENAVFSFMHSSIRTEEDLEQALKDGKNFLFLTMDVNPCGENITLDKMETIGETVKLYLNNNLSCGVCSKETITYIYEMEKSVERIEKIEPYMRTTSSMQCDTNVAYKPILYIYPTEEMDLQIFLENASSLTHTYPKYEKGWNIHVFPNGNIYDYHTKRNYYALYWEGRDTTKIDTTVGFVVAGDKTVSFLEEKLSYLGLNEREINEFIIYWIDKLENNPYNYIHFRTTEKMNEARNITFSKTPDTFLRIMMDYAPLLEEKEVKEQDLKSIKRTGFTVVEWGGRRISF